MLADSHCHLNYEGVFERQAEVLANARARGVTAMLNIATREREWDAVIATAEREPDVWATVGIHPHEADEHPEIGTERLVARAAHPRVVGIGESGLDYHYDRSDRARQRASFRAHIAAARETGLPIVVHTRDAEDDTASIMTDEMGKGAFPGVIDCFTASGDFADRALALGLYISVSGILTFRNATDLQATAARLPLERLLVETDAPFLAPVPHRGRPGEPAYVADTVAFLANLRGENPAALAETTARNFHTLFCKDTDRSRTRVKVRILGSGTSSGVPRVGNDWEVRDPGEPRNRRTRASIIVEHAGTRVLVDTSPDLREQLLAADIATIDAVIWTHDHADHVHGIDDLRQVFHALGRPVEGYARRKTMDVIAERFGYVFRGLTGYPPVVTMSELPDRLCIGKIDVSVVDQPHGRITSAGLRFEADGAAIGYATDFHELTPAMRTHYSSLDIWIVDALRRRPHPSHPTLDAILGWVEELRPGRSALVHMDQSMDYASLAASLPSGVVPGFDGLEMAC